MSGYHGSRPYLIVTECNKIEFSFFLILAMSVRQQLRNYIQGLSKDERNRLRIEVEEFVRDLEGGLISRETALEQVENVDPRLMDQSYWVEVFMANDWITSMWLAHPNFMITMPNLATMPSALNAEFVRLFEKSGYSRDEINEAIEAIEEYAENDPALNERLEYLRSKLI